MLLKYDIAIVGQRNVEAALAGIERRFIQHNQRVARATGTGAGGPYRSAPGRAKAQRDEASRGFAEIAKAAMIADRQRYREAVRLENQLNRQRARGFTEISRAAQAAERSRQRDALRSARNEAREVARYREQFGRGLGARARNVGSALGGVAAAVGSGAALVGGFAVGSKIQKEVELEQRIRGLRIAGRGPGQAGVSDEDIRSRARATSLATGVSETDAVTGMQAFVTKTGDLKTAMGNLQNFATIAKATGASVEDVASAAADLKEKFDLSKPEEMAEALAALAFQGKKGAFELRGMASQFPKIAAAAKGFGFKGASGVRELGGLAQIARKATGSDEQAASAVEATLRQLISKSKEIQSGTAFSGRKVQVFKDGDPKKDARGASEILTDVISASRGNLVQLQGVFGDEGGRTVKPMVAAYRDAYNATKGSDKEKNAAGKKALEALFKDAIDGGGTFADAQKDMQDALKTTASQLEILNTKIQEALGSKLLPSFQKMIPAFEKLIPILTRFAESAAKFVNFVAENPWKGVGIVIGAVVTKEIMAAALGNTLKLAIEKALGNRNPPPGGNPNPNAPGGVGTKPGSTSVQGVLNATGTGLTIGTAVAAGITSHGMDVFHTAEKLSSEGLKANQYAKGTSSRQTLVDNLAEQKKRMEKIDPTQRNDALGTAIKILGTGNILKYLVTDKATETAKKTQETSIKEAEKMLADFDAKSAGEQFKGVVVAAGKEAGAALKNELAGGVNRTGSPTQPRPN